MRVNKQTIFWDFDGVILQSNSVRDKGFELTLNDYPQHQVERLLAYHRKNGGLSRYVKFQYFFEEILGEVLNKGDLQKLTQAFSSIMLKELTNKELLIDEIIRFISAKQGKYKMFVVSGSDQIELRYLCKELEISKFFLGIYGSPTPKSELIRTVLNIYHLNPGDCFLVGDSINDFEAAQENGVDFYAYNNPELEHFPQFKDVISFA